MANPINRRFNHRSNIAIPVLGLLCATLLIHRSGAAEFAIGGPKGWSPPSDPSAVGYSQWAENNRFQIGDSIVFNYPPGQDSVLRVTQDDYTNCNTDASTAEKFTDGHTAYKFNQSGPFYFISGNKDNCVKNEKVVVIVLADRSNTSGATPPSPSKSSDITPSPAPSDNESPPPPPEESPSGGAPESLPPPPSGASSIFMSFIGSTGAFAASSSLLLL